MGALKLSNPSAIERRLRAYRREGKFDGRLRWASLGAASGAELAVARRALELICTDVQCDFACALLDRMTTDIPAVYSDEWQAYNRLAARAIGDVLDGEEVSAVVADRFDAPASHEIENPVRRIVNDRKRRLAVVGMQRVPSVGAEGLQLADLLLGAVTYQVRDTHAPLRESGPRMSLSLEVMQKHYQQLSYLRRGPGSLEMNHLRITMFPLPARGRGRRGGRRAGGRST